ncbi:hypothetical protein DFH07DRAFT_770507 [Mycena maculata]|uniref:Uncharacterized protein n=1 Tax=Mycena maculata TaxID=230809 RepID=A0AAD7JII3_9AGAR|nr:hypothetical protein DFH07DRAFT_770507 [Mycena maculata]
MYPLVPIHESRLLLWCTTSSMHTQRHESGDLRKIQAHKSERIKRLESADTALQDEVLSLQGAVKIKKEPVDFDLNATARISELESANTVLHAQVSSLQNSVKVKQERMELDSAPASDTIIRNDIEKDALHQKVKSLKRGLGTSIHLPPPHRDEHPRTSKHPTPPAPSKFVALESISSPALTPFFLCLSAPYYLCRLAYTALLRLSPPDVQHDTAANPSISLG